ncbi:MAG: DUF2029 domain-containing protein [Armatimonadetes bacterium]|nr:DUF2029 domain-containing protein [Armatimonadota bacterium]
MSRSEPAGAPGAGDCRRSASAARWEAAGWTLLAALLLVGTPVVIHRLFHAGGTDLPEFYAAGRYVLEHRARAPDTILRYYWPSLDAAFAVLALLPYWLAALLWYALNLAAFGGIVFELGWRWPAPLGPAARRQVALATGLSTIAIFLDNACLGSFHVIMVYAVLAGLNRVAEGRELRGGLLLGLAGWLKLLPLLAVPYLLVKRRPRPALVAVGVVLLLNVALSGLAYGPAGAGQATSHWWHESATRLTSDLLSEPAYIDTQRESNMSLPAFLRRSLSAFGQESPEVQVHMSVAALTASELTAVYALLMGVVVVVAGVCLARPAEALAAADWPRETALVLLACLWLSPVAWAYHFIAAAPALAASLTWAYGRPRRTALVAGLWLAAQAASIGYVGCALSGYLWVSLVLGFLPFVPKADDRPLRGSEGARPGDAVAHVVEAARQ